MTQKPVALDDGGSRLVISGDDIPFGAYQAIYHKLTKAVQKRTRVYKEAYEINFGDIKNLHHRLSQLIKQYAVKSSRCQVTHDLKEDTSREHSSFDKFSLSDCSTRSCSAKLNYELDFLVILPAEIPEASEIAQRFRLNVLIDQDFIEENDYDAPYFLRGFFLGRNISLSIEFSDFAISQSLEATVDGWIQTLPKRGIGKLSKFLYNSERWVKSYIGSIVGFLTLSGAALSAYRADDIKQSIAIGFLAWL